MMLMRSAALAALLLAPSAALANCRATDTLVTASAAAPCVMALNDPAPTAGPKRLRVEPAQPAYAIGDAFPIYDYSMLIDPPRYGLPAVTGNWRYYRADGHTYKVDAQSLAVLDVIEEGHAALMN